MKGGEKSFLGCQCPLPSTSSSLEEGLWEPDALLANKLSLAHTIAFSLVQSKTHPANFKNQCAEQPSSFSPQILNVVVKGEAQEIKNPLKCSRDDPMNDVMMFFRRVQG